MQKVTLYIETPDRQQTVTLADELSIGRTDAAQLILNDPSLSRLHATIFREGDEVWILDENSSNGSFVNGEKVAPERKLRDGDEISLGSNTRIYVEMPAATAAEFQGSKPKAAAATASVGQQSAPPPQQPPKPAIPAGGAGLPKEIPLIPLIAGAFGFFVIVFAGVAIILVSWNNGGGGDDDGSGKKRPKPKSTINVSAAIPKRVMDPLGGEDPTDLDDFLSSWEGEEEELKAENIEEIKTVSSADGTSKPATDLIVSRAFWEQQRAKSLSRPGGEESLIVPPQMSGRGFGNQLNKVRQLRDKGYKIPLDFGDLAELRLKGILVELPIATETYVLEVGGSAGGEEFYDFDFDRPPAPIAPGSEKYNYLKRLADNFDGQKYDLNDPQHRKQIRMRLLRMYNAKSRVLLEEICRAFYERFKIPLRITSLTRSMDYQIGLNKTNGNSYRVRDKNAVPPHTSGCAFDVGRNHLSGATQNFLMAKLSELESRDKLDTLIEGNVNACFHTFIYPDGVGPNQGASSPPTAATKPAANPPPATAAKPAKTK